MRKSFIFFAFLMILLGLIGCSNNEETAQKEIDPKKLLETLRANGSLVPLKAISIPDNNPMTANVVELGKMLFFDPRLSGNNERSCATCHDPAKGYGDGRKTFEKYNGEPGTRNSPTIINAGYYTTYFWDGRADSLEEQALGPIQNPNEMNQKLDELILELKGINDYTERFNAAFPDGVTEQNLAKAIAAFERQIVVKDTAFDQFMQGDTKALSDKELRGLELFTGKAMCSTCHNGPNLSDNNFYNVGLDSNDEGLYALTKKAGDMGKFRTAGLYGITHTAPYMHDGSLKTLEDVIDYYNSGGGDHRNKSFYLKNFMSPIGLSDAEKEDLLAFLKVLGGTEPIVEEPDLPGID
ncbi:cytochrome-c peroxidase [Bacillus sp. T3]|uniref:cytochrome-c peroxidase n=1 Tax=Bacillus sp. T3 TaxID=467262 RepID=UPI002980C027|nr:cytochrome c peroxidase [Bacillus sp. T3]